VISASGDSGSLARNGREAGRSIASGENRLGVPPPRKIVPTLRPPHRGQRALEIVDERVDVRAFGRTVGCLRATRES
jgi:hypothetical protein